MNIEEVYNKLAARRPYRELVDKITDGIHYNKHLFLFEQASGNLKSVYMEVIQSELNYQTYETEVQAEKFFGISKEDLHKYIHYLVSNQIEEIRKDSIKKKLKGLFERDYYRTDWVSYFQITVPDKEELRNY